MSVLIDSDIVNGVMFWESTIINAVVATKAHATNSIVNLQFEEAVEGPILIRVAFFQESIVKLVVDIALDVSRCPVHSVRVISLIDVIQLDV